MKHERAREQMRQPWQNSYGFIYSSFMCLDSWTQKCCFWASMEEENTNCIYGMNLNEIAKLQSIVLFTMEYLVSFGPLEYLQSS